MNLVCKLWFVFPLNFFNPNNKIGLVKNNCFHLKNNPRRATNCLRGTKTNSLNGNKSLDGRGAVFLYFHVFSVIPLFFWLCIYACISVGQFFVCPCHQSTVRHTTRNKKLTPTRSELKLRRRVTCNDFITSVKLTSTATVGIQSWSHTNYCTIPPIRHRTA